MPSTYTTNGGIELPANGEQSGTWGETVNDNMAIIDRLTNGVGAVSLSGTTHTLTTADGTLSDGQYNVLVLGGSPSGTNTITISPNDGEHVYIVKNASGQTATFTQGSGANVSVLNNTTKIIYADGAGAGAAVVDITGALDLGSLIIAGTAVTATAAELNLLDGSIAGTVVNSKAVIYGAAGQVEATTVEFDNLSGTGAVSVTNILDEDNMASDSATALATQQSIKAYVDAQVDTVDTLAEILAIGNTTGGTDLAVSAGDDITFADSSKAIFGAGSDLQIYHDGSNSYIDDTGTGNLLLRGASSVRFQSLTGENMVVADQNGAVFVYHDNLQKLATTATGIDVTGTVVAAAGTALLPSITTTGDLNTGMWFPAADTIAFSEGGVEALRINSSGNVGIGSTVTTARANVWGANIPTGAGIISAHGQLAVYSTSTYGANIGGTLSLGGDGGTYQNVTYATVSGRKENASVNNYDGYLAFAVSKDTLNTVAERMRIDSSGNLLVGKTADDVTVVGTQINYDGFIGVTRSANITAVFNRTTSDGDIVSLRKDGTTVGSIGVYSGDLTIGDGDIGIRFDTGTGLVPWNVTTNVATNGTSDLGASTARFKDLYLSGGVYLGGTVAANLLDDYEEGTWTAELKGSTGSATTPVTETGTYTKVGNVVTVHVGFANVTTTGASGSIQVIGLPFTNTSANPCAATLGIYTNLAHSANSNPVVYINASANLIQGTQLNDSAVGANWNITATTGVYFYVSVTYTI
jgi:hypothetical protein